MHVKLRIFFVTIINAQNTDFPNSAQRSKKYTYSLILAYIRLYIKNVNSSTFHNILVHIEKKNWKTAPYSVNSNKLNGQSKYSKITFKKNLKYRCNLQHTGYLVRSRHIITNGTIILAKPSDPVNVPLRASNSWHGDVILITCAGVEKKHASCNAQGDTGKWRVAIRSFVLSRVSALLPSGKFGSHSAMLVVVLLH